MDVRRTVDRQPLGRASRATQLACLERFLRDGELVWDLRTAWAALSRTCHHHPYELAPTAPELERWLDAVDQLIGRLVAAETVA